MMRFLATAVATAVFFACAAVAVEPATVDLPQMGEPADAAMSPAQEAEIGAQVVAQFYANDLVLEDPEVSEYIQTMGWKLASNAAAGDKPPRFTFFVVQDRRINAFALPGGYIGINAGLMMSARNESELAGVMGHEQAHVTQRHIARSQQEGELANIATWAAVLAAIIAGSANPDIIIAALSLGQAASYQRAVNYTRAHELEADRLGIRTMASSGYDPDGMATFFSRLEQQSRLYGNQLPDILKTHPVNTVRVSEARARATNMGPRQHKDSLDYQLMQARARALTIQPREAVDHFAGEIDAGRASVANRYGLAVALSLQGRSDEAVDALAPALSVYPRQVNLNMLQAKLLLAQGRTEQALSAYNKLVSVYPRYAPAVLDQAAALIAADRAADARQLLLSHDLPSQRMEANRLLAQAAHELGNTAEEAFQTANYRFERGDLIGAREQLDAALRLTTLSGRDRARLRARRDEIWDATPPELRRTGPRPT
jgi:predicted Zn-dependent protease